MIFTMPTVKKKSAKKTTPPPNPVGRPSEFKEEYCAALISHMATGGSIESFGAKINHSKQSIYNWFEQYPKFLDARKVGEPYLHLFYENLGKSMASGNLRRVKSETPVLTKDENGKDVPVLDKDGNIIYQREYEPTTGGQSTWIFMCKNMLKWRDRHDVEVSGKDGGSVNFSNLSNEELDKKIEELVEMGQKSLRK